MSSWNLKWETEPYFKCTLLEYTQNSLMKSVFNQASTGKDDDTRWEDSLLKIVFGEKEGRQVSTALRVWYYEGLGARHTSENTQLATREGVIWLYRLRSGNLFAVIYGRCGCHTFNSLWHHHIWKLGESTQYASATSFLTHFGSPNSKRASTNWIYYWVLFPILISHILRRLTGPTSCEGEQTKENGQSDSGIPSTGKVLGRGCEKSFQDTCCLGKSHDFCENVVSAYSQLTLEVVQDTADDVMCSPFLMSVRRTHQRDEVWIFSVWHLFALVAVFHRRCDWSSEGYACSLLPTIFLTRCRRTKNFVCHHNILPVEELLV